MHLDAILYRKKNCQHSKGSVRLFFGNVLLKANSAFVCFRICIVSGTDPGCKPYFNNGLI